MNQDKDEENTGTPPYEWWVEAFKHNPEFKKYIESMTIPPGVIPPWDPVWKEEKND